MKNNEIVIGLVGNPNSGKTTIFNALTGARQKVANWSGVTVEKREGVLKQNGHTIKIVDLPGIYSLSSYSIEEIVARNFIINENPDVIINVVDAGNLDRNLYLTTQLIEMGAKVCLALNMIDEAKSKGLIIKTDILGTLLGMPVVETVARKSIGIKELIDSAITVAEKRSQKTRHLHLNYSHDIENEISKIQSCIWSNHLIGEKYSTRWLSIRLLENDNDIIDKLKDYPNYNEIINQGLQSRRLLEKKFNDDVETILSDMRYGFISGALKESIKKTA